MCDLEPVSFVLVFPARVSQCTSGCPGTSFLALAGFELIESYLPLPSKCWDLKVWANTALLEPAAMSKSFGVVSERGGCCLLGMAAEFSEPCLVQA